MIKENLCAFFGCYRAFLNLKIKFLRMSSQLNNLKQMKKNKKNDANLENNRNSNRRVLKYNLKQINTENNEHVENAINVDFQSYKAFCDITGLPAHYKCSKTGILCHDLAVFEFVKEMKIEDAKRYVKMRNLCRRHTFLEDL
ncbi:hypothetical protein EDEG_02773 [Edhazardia aedis USNM 41457]|uniref:Vps72/YL1 C-terminal domain-containing protein n=1 Tax=Edhazardia aedis (strain USNM 41457) TaxID=1003232 RepID=J9DN75_EDHAE|nr:hypothetical protein EDEG_02773 [Edhazardia aedis USNM 41457]|eukprot:EJW02832.1 hypothetical protein EDEG_02773 [Edhazardia aedis USNM 41457]